MSLSPPKSTVPQNGGRSAWGPKPEQSVVEAVGAPPSLLLPAHLAIDSDSLAAVCAKVQAAVAAAVRDGVAEGFATAWPRDEPTPTAPPATG